MKRPVEYPKSWTTDDEIWFLRGLGLTWRSTAPNISLKWALPRLDLLKNYYNSMSMRINWGEIDQARIRHTVLMMMGQEIDPNLKLHLVAEAQK